MRITIILSFLFTFYSGISQIEKKEFQTDSTTLESIQGIVDLIIEEKKDVLISFPNLYSSLALEIPSNQDEKIALSNELKKRGFIVVNWGRGNYPPNGARIISIDLEKDNCACQVNKFYLYTTFENQFQMVESISCKEKK
ncbi:MAG: hypothetical protein R2799_05335 [Crocinitomicaceae bacterium]